MLAVWIVLFFLLPGSSGFMIYNARRSLCVEDSPGSGLALLKRCDLDSEFQQWAWSDHGTLMCVASSRCLSARDAETVRTEPCPGSEVASVGLEWDCDRDRLISRDTMLLLAAHRGRLTLTQDGRHTKWRSLDEGDICQEKLRFRRESVDSQDYEGEDQQKMAAMTEEQRQYLMWFYRSEDPTMWKFAMLALAFICLLVGFLLLGMGCMANKSRKKIAKYKVAAALAQRSEVEELQVLSELGEESKVEASTSNGEVGELRPGNIMVTWKDGNTSSLYPEPAATEEEAPEREKEAGREEEKQEEASPSEKQEEASPSEKQEEASPSEKQEEASPSEKQEEASPSEKQEEASPSEKQEEASPSEKQEEASPSELEATDQRHKEI